LVIHIENNLKGLMVFMRVKSKRSDLEKIVIFD
jgi:hypothetical protein